MAAAWAMGQQREHFAVPPWRFGVLDVGAHGMARNYGRAACEPAGRSFAVYCVPCTVAPACCYRGGSRGRSVVCMEPPHRDRSNGTRPPVHQA